MFPGEEQLPGLINEGLTCAAVGSSLVISNIPICFIKSYYWLDLRLGSRLAFSISLFAYSCV